MNKNYTKVSSNVTQVTEILLLIDSIHLWKCWAILQASFWFAVVDEDFIFRFGNWQNSSFLTFFYDF